jgi:Fe2+ transport system protein FeoA
VGGDAVVLRVLRDNPTRAERLKALGVTPGARIRLLQRFPGFVFQCDQTELAVEPSVARAIIVGVDGQRGGPEPSEPAGSGVASPAGSRQPGADRV